ncbi:AP complex subunit beta, partial [Haematococcus lacustris]
MGCIRVEKISEYLCGPLSLGLKDTDPYVRKTAAVCVAKLFDISQFQVETHGFVSTLREMLSDANPMVVANALASLQEISELVVLSAVKVLMRMMDLVGNEDQVRAWSKKMAPPLVTLLGTEPEVQYVALRNINLIVQKRPAILANEVKYNDPIYVKMEKLEIMIRLASDKNIDQVLLEFKEYAQEVDVDFVRKAVRAIGRCAVSIERAAEKCINVLLELIATKVNYVVQEAIIVIKDIFRRYPNQYESIISTLCDNLDSLDEPEAK